MQVICLLHCTITKSQIGHAWTKIPKAIYQVLAPRIGIRLKSNVERSVAQTDRVGMWQTGKRLAESVVRKTPEKVLYLPAGVEVTALPRTH
jgi:hypothetical protein